jgi:hypothetical protein
MSPPPSPVAAPQDVELPSATPASNNMEANHSNALVRYCSIQDIMVATTLGEQAEVQGEDLLVVNTEEPASFQEA